MTASSGTGAGLAWLFLHRFHLRTSMGLGPIDVAVIGYPAGAPMTGEAVPLLLDLVDRGVIHVFDALFVRKDADGTCSGFDPRRSRSEDRAGDLTAFAGALDRPAQRR